MAPVDGNLNVALAVRVADSELADFTRDSELFVNLGQLSESQYICHAAVLPQPNKDSCEQGGQTGRAVGKRGSDGPAHRKNPDCRQPPYSLCQKT